MDRPLRIYVDQLHLVPSDELNRLRACALRGQLAAPISITQLVETLRAPPERRARIVEALVDLARDELLLPEHLVAVSEADVWRRHAPADAAWGRVTTQNIWDWADLPTLPFYTRAWRKLFPLRAGRFLPMLPRIGSTQFLKGLVASRLAPGIADANRRRSSLPSLRDAVLSLGIPGVDGVPDEHLPNIFRAIATRRALQEELWRSQPDGMRPNDAMDVFALAVAVPYCDAVCVDSAMAERIKQARSRVKFPWARAFSRLPDLLSWVRAALEARRPETVS